MAGAVNISFGDCYVSKNGVRPIGAFSHQTYGDAVHRAWYTIGLKSSSEYVNQSSGTLGTAYPANRGSHSTSGYFRVTSGLQDNDSHTVEMSIPRIAQGLSGFSTGLTAGAEYQIQLWVKHSQGDTDLIFNISQDIQLSTTDVFTIGTPIVPTYKGFGVLDYTLNELDTKNCTVDIYHEQGITDASLHASNGTWGGVSTLMIQESYRNNSAVPLPHTRIGITSSNETNNFFRYKLENKVNGDITYFPAIDSLYSVFQTAIEPNTTIIHTGAFDVTSTGFKCKLETAQPHCSTGTLTCQVATNAAFTQNVIDSSSNDVLVQNGHNFTGGEDVTINSGQSRKSVVVSNLTASTTYYFRARVVSTNNNNLSDNSESQVLVTNTVKLAVKTPAKHQVGYFFAGNFSAFKKLNKIDLPELTPSWKTACVINGVVYLGNVKYKNTDGTTVYKPDRILKSLPNQVDTFTKYNYIDVAIEDGDDVIALNFVGERLLEFKRNKLYVINVGSEYEYLEATYDGVGVNTPSSICKMPYGVVFANHSGCYLYDGRQVQNLLQKDGKQIFNKKIWSDFISNDSMVAYIQEKNIIIVTDTSSATSVGDAYLFDIDSKCWTYYKKGLPSGYKTNFITDTKGRSLFANGLSGDYYYPQIDDGGNNEFEYQSKELDFGDPTSLKKLYEMTISYANNGMVMQPLVYYSTDSGKTFKLTESGNFRNHNADTGWYNATFQFQSSANASYVYPTCQTLIIRIKPNGIATGFTNFKLNEINIEYRVIHKRILSSTSDTSTDTTGTTANSVGITTAPPQVSSE